MAKDSEIINDLKIANLEQQITRQTQEIKDLKDLVYKLGEKLTRDIKTEEEKKISRTAYWERLVQSCNQNNYYTCSVCEIVPKTNHYLKIRTCSPKCSAIIESTISLQSKKDGNS